MIQPTIGVMPRSEGKIKVMPRSAVITPPSDDIMSP